MIDFILETEKNPKICETVVKVLSNQFSGFKLSAEDLMIDEYFIHYSLKNNEIIYASLSKLNNLNSDDQTIVLCFSWVALSLRNLGIGTKFLSERVKYFKSKFPNLLITASCRVKNKASLKVFYNNNFKCCFDFTYQNGDLGVKLINI